MQEELEDSWEVEPCYPAMVVADNNTTKFYTEIIVEVRPRKQQQVLPASSSCPHTHASSLALQVKDYPGLLRVIAWVLNGE